MLDVQIIKSTSWRAVAEDKNRDSRGENTNRRASLVALGVVVVLFVIAGS